MTDEQSAKVRRKLVVAQQMHEPLVYGQDWEYKPITSRRTRRSSSRELALRRDDWAAAHDSADHVLELAGRFRELRRGLLVAGRPSR